MAISSTVVTSQMEGGYTYTKKHKILYKWEVKNISSRLEPTQNESLVLFSSEFTTGSKLNDKWRLGIYFNNGLSPKYPVDYLTMFLSNSTDYAISAKCSFSFMNIKKELVNNFMSMASQEMAGKHFMKKDLLAEKSELISNDILTVCAEVIVYDDNQKVPFEVSTDSSKKSLAEDLKNLNISDIKSDVMIIVENKRFEANKAIINARCPVLAAMITNDLTEKKLNQVSITGIAPETFGKLLQYIYTDQIPDLDLVAVDLLEAADKYQLHSLKKICEVSLCKNLNCYNIIEAMTLAERHNATNLLEYVTKCFMVDSENIAQSESFKKIQNSTFEYRVLQLVIAAIASLDHAGVIYSS